MRSAVLCIIYLLLGTDCIPTSTVVPDDNVTITILASTFPTTVVVPTTNVQNTDNTSDSATTLVSTKRDSDTTTQLPIIEVPTTTTVSSEGNKTTSNREEKQLNIDRITCPCDPNGGLQNSPCSGGRIAKDQWCPCRKICWKQAGQSCNSNDICDEEFGLKCDPDSLTCQGPLMIQRTEVTHDSLSVRWRNSKTASVAYSPKFRGNETTWTEAQASEGTAKLLGLKPNTEYYVKVEGGDSREITLIRTKDGCTINDTSHVGLGEVFNVGCEKTCTCMQNGKTECRDRCNFRPGSISDPSCKELPDENDRCCVVYHCKDTPIPVAPKLLVTHRTPDSLTLAWDDFKVPNYEAGYIVEYRPKDQNWTQVQAGNIPLMTITKLQPYTEYQIRVSVWEDEDSKKLGRSSEIVTIFTEDGCQRDNMTYGVSEEFNLGCERKCICKGNNVTECRDRCLLPYVRPGNSDSNCIESPIGDDGCCVSVNCSNIITSKVGQEVKSYSDKLGDCPANLTNDNCTTQCHHDHECKMDAKCCPTTCGGMLCIEPVTTRGACSNTVCGHNAFCVPHPMGARCECEIGYSGDANDLITGCVMESSSYICTYKNATYHMGEVFNDGCNAKCRCDDDLQVKCQPTDCPEDQRKEQMEGRHFSSLEKSMPMKHNTTMEKVTELPKMITEIATEMSTLVEKTTEIAEQVKNEAIETTTKIMDKPTEMPKETIIPTTNMSVKRVENSTDIPIIVTDHTTRVAKEITDQTTEMTMNAMLNTAVMLTTTENATEGSMTIPALTTTLQTTEHMMEHTTNTELMMADRPGKHPGIMFTSGTEPPTTPYTMKSTDNFATTEANVIIDATTITTTTEHAIGRSEDDAKMVHKDHPIRAKGCDFGGRMYDLNEHFFDGCEAKCICDGNGHISCVPRCPLMGASSDKCQLVVDPNDSCCRIILCDAPGDVDTVATVKDIKIKIDSIMAQNATSINLRITSVNDTDSSFQLWYASTENGSADGITWWTKMKLSKSELKSVENGVYEAMVHGLKPDTEYYFKVKGISGGHETFSNTVSAKTFPPAVKASFTGCFRHNKTYESGEVFYDGCEYKCVCQKNGQIECRERCDVYIDTVGFEHCRWGPAPDDACCTIPLCDQPSQPPPLGSQEPSCIVEDGRVYQIGEKWEEECTRKLCSCVLLPNGTTHAECTGGCAPIPAAAQRPNSECPQPVLVTPDDPCICPYIVCNNAVSPLNVPLPMCQFKGRSYHLGEEFYDGCRAVCHCGRDLTANCAVIECPQQFSPHISECLEWDVDPTFVPTPPQCCPPPRCKNDGSCVLNGIRFTNFQPIPNQLLDCGTRCVCVHGNVTCENKCPPVSDIPPTNLPCSPALAFRGHLPGDDCCLHWMCRDQDRKAHHCTYHGRSYQPGEQWEVRKGSLRRLCTCQILSDEQTEVECTGGCPPIQDHYQRPTSQCPRPVLVRPEDPVMCPYIVCNNTASAKELQNVSMVALNATSIRVRFTLPSLLVGLVGHAELHFTSDPTIPRSAWHVQKFARPKRLFDTPNIEYHMSGLRPETLYFLQIKVVITALQGGPESDVYKLRMPHISTTTRLMTTPTTTTTTTAATTTTTMTTTTTTTTEKPTTTMATTTTTLPTTTTTTTTLPPMIILNPSVSIQLLDSKTAKVSWRPFEPQEKRLIDGYRIKYKAKGDSQWKVSPMIHRDVMSYMLRDLQPSASYMIDLVFATPEGLPTHLVSSSPVEMKMPEEPRDNYDFQVALRQDKLGPYSMEIIMSGVPEPVTKYVNVVKVTYKSDNDNKQQEIFNVPKTHRIKLENLKPGKRYKASMEIFLSNGKMLSSNVIDFMTKAAPPGLQSKQEVATHEEKSAEALHSSFSEDENKAYYIALIVVAIVAAVAGLGFVVLLIILLKKQSTAKAPITRNSSESAYDNPTYKVTTNSPTYDGERYEEKSAP